jgi:hypothetical protein
MALSGVFASISGQKSIEKVKKRLIQNAPGGLRSNPAEIFPFFPFAVAVNQ